MKSYTLVILISAGVIIGILSLWLVEAGNPPNMGVCVACFLRDTAGGLQLQIAPPVQYMRPEIFGFVLGAFASSIVFKEFSPRAGSVPVTRFMLGFFMMIGCLVFLGCPLRMMLRIGAGDLNAVVGLVGLATGIAIGCFFLTKQFALPSNQKQSRGEGVLFPIICLGIVCLLFIMPSLFAMSKTGPGSMHAPIIYALLAGLIIGLIVERTNFCTIGFISHLILFQKVQMLLAVFALMLVVFLGNLYFGHFKLGFNLQPIAHTDGVWNFLSMLLVGICGVFLGGCPLRQLVKAGKGDGDAVMVVLGMLLGAAIAHNFGMASVAQNATNQGGATFAGKLMVVIGIVFLLFYALFYSYSARKAAVQS